MFSFFKRPIPTYTFPKPSIESEMFIKQYPNIDPTVIKLIYYTGFRNGWFKRSVA